MLFTALPSTKYSPIKLTLLIHCHRLFALSYFSNSGDGPHWVIHTLSQSPKNPGESFTWGLPGLAMHGLWLWSRAPGRWTVESGGWKERLSLSGWMEPDQIGLLKGTQKWYPSYIPGALCCPSTFGFGPSWWSIAWWGGARRVPALVWPVFCISWIKPGKFPSFPPH